MTFNQFFYFCFAASCLLFSCNSQDAANPQTASSGSAQNAESKQEAPPEPMSKKKETLTKLVGEHSLFSISGFMGANTMIDYTLKNGKWSAVGSSIYMAQRESFDQEITASDLKKLNSMKIIVNPDLSVSFSCNGKEFENIPYQEDGMSYSLKKAPKDYYSAIPEKLNIKTTFIDDELFLFASDKTSAKKMEELDIMSVLPNTLVIKFNSKTNEFIAQLINSEMSDNGVYSFK